MTQVKDKAAKTANTETAAHESNTETAAHESKAVKSHSNTSMEQLLKMAPPFTMPKAGSLIDGKVVTIYKNKILVDINGINTGIITGKEARDAGDTAKKLKAGDTVAAYVIEEENDEGYTVLSLRKASQERTWQNFEEAFNNGTVIEVSAREANKGGLLLEIDGIKGFIPVSQLAPMHYPRVNGADTGLILRRLQQLIGIKFSVKIINVDKLNGKLILSEKAAYEDQRKKSLHGLKIGSTAHGRISGIVKFGIFVTFDGLEGLVHISEIAWGHVKDPADYGKLGDEVDIMVIGLDGEKISLSMKRLQEDPWLVATRGFKIGDIIEGEINRITPFGAFMKLGDDLNGLIHLTEIPGENIKDPSEVLKVGNKMKAKIIAIEPSEHRIGLSIKAVEATGKSKKKTKSEDVKKAEESVTTEEVPKKAANEQKSDKKEEKVAETKAEETETEAADAKKSTKKAVKMSLRGAQRATKQTRSLKP